AVARDGRSDDAGDRGLLRRGRPLAARLLPRHRAGLLRRRLDRAATAGRKRLRLADAARAAPRDFSLGLQLAPGGYRPRRAAGRRRPSWPAGLFLGASARAWGIPAPARGGPRRRHSRRWRASTSLQACWSPRQIFGRTRARSPRSTGTSPRTPPRWSLPSRAF